MNYPMLNEVSEAAVCKRMLEVAQRQLEVLETKLTERVLPHEQYLQTIGAAIAMRAIVVELDGEYRRGFPS